MTIDPFTATIRQPIGTSTQFAAQQFVYVVPETVLVRTIQINVRFQDKGTQQRSRN